MPRSRLALISPVYLPKARWIFLLKCALRSLMKSTSEPSRSWRRRLNSSRLRSLCGGCDRRQEQGKGKGGEDQGRSEVEPGCMRLGGLYTRLAVGVAAGFEKKERGWN